MGRPRFLCAMETQRRPSALRALAIVPAASGLVAVSLSFWRSGAPNFLAPAGHSSTDLNTGLQPAILRSLRGKAAEQRQLSAASAVAAGCVVGLAAGLAILRRPLRSSTRTGRRAEKSDVVLDDCPFTVWGQKDIDMSKVEANFKPMPLELQFSTELPDAAGDALAQEQYFVKNRLAILEKLKDHGAVIFRGFELMKEPEGFQAFYEAMQLDPCVDPLHSVSARDMVSKKGGIYEAVNKESRQRFFVGMHNEMVGNRTPGAAAFVCFKPAEEGGEFLLLDGRKMVSELDKHFLERLYQREIRYSTAEFPMGFLDSPPFSFAKDLLTPIVESAMKFAVKMKVDFETELVWATSDYDNARILQVRAQPQPPVLRHPQTGQPVWFFNVHSHSAWLREEREKVYGDEGLESSTGASRINRTDCYYADTGDKLTTEDLRYLDKVTTAEVKYIKMQKGDVVLLDNYAVMHGRAPFRGTRKHAVTWFKQPDYSEISK